MKAMYAAFAATAVISVAAWFVLGELGFSADETNAGPAVRLDDS